MNILGVIGSILWVVGVSIWIASAGWRIWLQRGGQTFSPGYLDNKPFYLGAYLFFIGILLSANTLWVRILSILLIIAFSIAISVGRISARKRPH